MDQRYHALSRRFKPSTVAFGYLQTNVFSLFLIGIGALVAGLNLKGDFRLIFLMAGPLLIVAGAYLWYLGDRSALLAMMTAGRQLKKLPDNTGVRW